MVLSLTYKLHKTGTRNYNFECKQDPGQVHGFELGAKPEIDNLIFIQLAPYIQDW